MTYYIPSTDTVKNSDFPQSDTLGGKAYNKYLKTLQSLGYIDSYLNNSLLVYNFLKEYQYSHNPIIDNDIKKLIYDTLYCIESKSCLFN